VFEFVEGFKPEQRSPLGVVVNSVQDVGMGVQRERWLRTVTEKDVSKRPIQYRGGRQTRVARQKGLPGERRGVRGSGRVELQR
jgi:hypothetical protein